MDPRYRRWLGLVREVVARKERGESVDGESVDGESVERIARELGSAARW